MNPLRLLAALAILCSAALTGCATVSTAWKVGFTSRQANDRIMLVRREPPSFGMKRLTYHAQLFPDIAIFLAQAGQPDFIAEMSNKDRHYLILYYLAARRAYACRTHIQNHREVEFAGPYPITPKEYRTLTGFQRQSAQVNAMQRQGVALSR